VEAATENVNLKFKIFEELAKVARPGAILASNTSSISITAIAAHTDRPDRVIGMHFMNPVPLMALVEIIRGLATTDEVYAEVKEAAEKMGKTTVLGRDMPGFIVNRVLMPYINEAVYALYEGIGSVEDIDTAMNPGTNVPARVHTLIDGRYRLSVFHGTGWGELYDLANDPGEFDNLWDDPAHKTLRGEMSERLLLTEIEHVDPSTMKR